MKHTFKLSNFFGTLLLMCGTSSIALAAEEKASASSDVPVLGTPSEEKKAPFNLSDNWLYSLMTLDIEGDFGAKYLDNIYKASSGEESDVVVSFAPEISLESNLTEHEFGFRFAPEFGYYLADERNNYADWVVEADGRYDFSVTDALRVGALYKHGHVGIGSFEDDAGSINSEPVEYDLYRLEAAYTGRHDLTHYELAGRWDSYDYDSVFRRDTTFSNQDDRDHDEREVIGKLGYEFVQPYVFYIRGGANERDYDHRVDSSATYRLDSDGYEAAVGVSRDIPEEDFSFDTFIGYMDQDYDAVQLSDIEEVDFYFDGEWKITPNDILGFNLDRWIKDSTTNGVSGIVNTRVGADFTHIYNEKLSVGADASYTNADFETNQALNAIDRDDDIYDLGLNSRYILSHNAKLKLEYDYRKRNSNRAFASYDSHAVGLTLALEY